MIKVKLTEAAKSLTRTTDHAFLPTRATDGSNGYDLFACIAEPVTLLAGEIFKFPTGVHIWLGAELLGQTGGNMAYAGLYLPRSSNKGMKLSNTVGLLDSDYTGQSFLKYKNESTDTIVVKTGDRIGQLLIVPSFIIPMEVVESFEGSTERGEGGFGHTGE